MVKKNTKKNKKKNADHKENTMIKGESSSAAEKAVSSERNSIPEPETKQLGDTLTPEQEKELEKIEEEESWMKKVSSERKSLASPANEPVLLFATTLDSDDANPVLDRVVLDLCHQRIKDSLSISEKFKKITHLNVLARDPQKREHRLRFSRYGEENFILHHGWAKIVAENGLKEGYEVYGNGLYVPSQFRVVLSFKKEEKRSLDSNVSREKKKMIFLFEKKLDSGDLKQQLTINCCCQTLKIAPMEPYFRVLASDPNAYIYELRLTRCLRRQGIYYVLGHGWGRVVADNGLEEGDTVTGFGSVFGQGCTAVLHFIKHGGMDVAIREQKMVYFFEKKLEFQDINTLLDQLEIESCKEVVQEIVAKAEEVEGSEGYVRVYATVEEGRKYELRLSRDSLKGTYVLYHQWRDVVASNGLMWGDTVTCWGGLAEDGTMEMWMDVCKAIENA